MAYVFDIRAVMKEIIKAMIEKIFGFVIPLILYIDSKSLYDYLVK